MELIVEYIIAGVKISILTVVFVLGSVASTMIYAGCSESPDAPIVKGAPNQRDGSSKDSSNVYFPPNAENVKHLNEHWATFELEGEKFLVHRYWIRSKDGG